jgi:pilus assembly protein CpaB
MKPKTLVLLFVAVGCGLAASYMTSRLLAERGNHEQVEVEKVKILVARKNLAQGTHLKNPEELFEEKQFTKGEEPRKAIREFEQLKDKRLNKPLGAEQFVTNEDVVDRAGAGMGANMPKGMRAFGIKVTAETSTGGFVLPNSHVDVVWVKRAGDNDSQAKIILQNVLVLATDQTDISPEDKKAVVASTVTIAVRPEQAEMLSLAMAQGDLRLILRPFDDDEVVRTNGATPKGIARGGDIGDATMKDDNGPVKPGLAPRINVPDVPAPAPTAVVENKPAEQTPPPPKTHTLTVINGPSVTRATFLLDENGDVTGSDVARSQPDQTPAKKPSAQPAPATPAPVAPVVPQVPAGLQTKSN